MRKLILIIFTLSACALHAQKTVPHDKRNSWEYLDGARTILRPYGYYMSDINLSGDSLMDYFRDINIFADGDTVNITFENTRAHEAMPGGMRVLKVPKGSTANNKYSTVTSDFYIPRNNFSHGFAKLSGGGDTIWGPIYADNYLTDTFVGVDRNFNRLVARPFDQAAIGISDTSLFISQPVSKGSFWYLTGYYRPSDDLKTGIIMRTSNHGHTWDTVKTFPTTQYFLPEEPSLILGAGDTLIWFCRSDFGTRTWVSRSADGVTWSAPVIAFQGANQPRTIAIDSVIVCYGRPVGYPTIGQGIRYFSDTVRPQPYRDYTTYTNIGVSLDNGRTWDTYMVDKTRAESFNWPGLSSETGHFYRIGGDTLRFVWATGNEGLGDHDAFGDLNQTTFVINRYQRGDVQFIGGGISANIPNHNKVFNVDSLNLEDTASHTNVNVQLNNKTLSFSGNADTLRSNMFLTTTRGFGLNAYPFETGRFFDYRNEGQTEKITGGDGNFLYKRVTGAPAFRIFTAHDGTLTAPQANLSGDRMPEISVGGNNGGSDVNTWGIEPFATQNFATAYGTKQFFYKSKQGSTSAVDNRYCFIDSANRVYYGDFSSQPVLTASFNIQGSTAIGTPVGALSSRLNIKSDGTNPILRLEYSGTSGAPWTVYSNGELGWGSSNNTVSMYQATALGTPNGAPSDMTVWRLNAADARSAGGAPIFGFLQGTNWNSTTGNTNTTGIVPFVKLHSNFTPSSGTAIYNHLLLTGTMAPTGSFSGKARGIYVSLTRGNLDLTAIEVASGKTILRDSTFITVTPALNDTPDTFMVKGSGGLMQGLKNPFADGTFTPTLTNVANISSSTAHSCIYSKNDSTITVSGKIEFTTTSGGGTLTRLGISIPFASNFTTDDDCSGTAWDFNDLEGAVIISDATNDRVELTYHDDTAATHIMRFTCQYRIK